MKKRKFRDRHGAQVPTGKGQTPSPEKWKISSARRGLGDAAELSLPVLSLGPGLGFLKKARTLCMLCFSPWHTQFTAPTIAAVEIYTPFVCWRAVNGTDVRLNRTFSCCAPVGDALAVTWNS